MPSPVEPMYMAGLFLTASMPPRTLMLSASYACFATACFAATAFFLAKILRPHFKLSKMNCWRKIKTGPRLPRTGSESLFFWAIRLLLLHQAVACLFLSGSSRVIHSPPASRYASA